MSTPILDVVSVQIAALMITASLARIAVALKDCLTPCGVLRSLMVAFSDSSLPMPVIRQLSEGFEAVTGTEVATLRRRATRELNATLATACEFRPSVGSAHASKRTVYAPTTSERILPSIELTVAHKAGAVLTSALHPRVTCARTVLALTSFIRDAFHIERGFAYRALSRRTGPLIFGTAPEGAVFSNVALVAW